MIRIERTSGSIRARALSEHAGARIARNAARIDYLAMMAGIDPGTWDADEGRAEDEVKAGREDEV